MISITNFFFQYQKASDDFSLSLPQWEINEGESVVFYGASGCGKSTLLKCISGQILPQKGSIVVCGKDVTQLDDEQRRFHRLSNIGIVFQDYPLIPYLNAVQNVLLPFRIHPDLRLEKQNIEYAKHLLESLGLSNKETRLPQALSQGERQRVAICRALIVKPKVLLADEPTAGLDSKRSQDIIDVIFSLQQQYNLSVVVVTHDENVKSRFEQRLDIANLEGMEGTA